MTTVQPGFPNLPFVDMSYDEIDFAERVGDDDIDIDIDLETGQNDEDYILEDANSDVAHEEANISNDDVMIDDENVSYPMDDVDILQKGHIEMEDADLSEMPISEPIIPGIDAAFGENARLYTADLDNASEAVVDEPHSHEGPLRDVAAEQVPEDQTLTDDTRFSSKRRGHTDSTLSPPTSPIQHEPGAQMGTNQYAPSSGPDDSSLLSSGPGNQEPTDTIFSSERAMVAGQTQDETEIKSDKGDNIMMAANNVIVIYQDAEYALVSSSESDDPDTFFLRDASLISGSLAGLLAGLREVVHEDLGPEDELCLAVEDLGIEITETCVSIHDMNLASVVDLHEKLLRNDGVEISRPLYVTLGTKPDFAKRLAILVAEAADGKGLSELIAGDEESDDFDEDDQSIPVRESEEFQNTELIAQVLPESTENYENKFVGDVAGEQQLPGSVNLEQNTAGKAEDTKGLEDNNGEQVSEDQIDPAVSDSTLPPLNSADQQSHFTVRSTEAADYSKDGLDEDGDFIDYEDEDYEQGRKTSTSANVVPQVDRSGKQDGNSPDFIEPCLKPAVCFCPACIEQLLIDYEENNNELDRRYLARAAERDAPLTQPDSNAASDSPIYADQNPGENANRGTEDNGDDFAGYQEHGERVDGQASINGETFGENIQQDDEFHNPYNEFTQEEGQNGNVGADTIAINDEDGFNTQNLDHRPEPIETIDNDLEEVDYSTMGQDMAASHHADHEVEFVVDNQGSNSFAAIGYHQDTDEINYEDADVPESNESEHTLKTHESEQEHDEINYETDDQEDLNAPSEGNAIIDASPISNGLTGKRSRADAEDVTDRASKQFKRARS